MDALSITFRGPTGGVYELARVRPDHDVHGHRVVPEMAAWLLYTALPDPANAHVIPQAWALCDDWLPTATRGDLPVLIEALAAEVCHLAGRFVVRELCRPHPACDDPRAHAVWLDDLLDPDHPHPCDPEDPDDPPEDPDRWISFEVLHRNGGLFPNAEFVLTHPDGSTRRDRLGADSRWHGDGIPSGNRCHVRFDPPLELEHAVTQPSDEPVELVDKDISSLPGSPKLHSMPIEQHNRIVLQLRPFCFSA